MIPKIRYADSGGVKIAYFVVGDGPIDILRVPGFANHLEIAWEQPAFVRQNERLGAFARVIMFDRRGIGLSDREGGISTLEPTVDDMRAVLDAVGSERAAILGHSEGGAASILFAAAHPERTAALIPIGSTARFRRADDYEIGFPEDLLRGNIEAMERQWGEPIGIDFFAPSKASDDRFRRWWARLVRSGSSPSGAHQLLTINLELDIRHVLPAVRVPTLVLHSRGDLAVPIAMGRYLADHIDGAKLVELDSGDHFVFWFDADRIADEIEQFLTGQRPVATHDRVLATVLFTDIVDSTKRAAEMGDQSWQQLLATHNEIVRAELERFRGREISTTGDGFLASFDGPARAVRAAEAIRRAVGSIGIDIRAGLHTGECQLSADGVGDIAVHIAARVIAAAGPGEILVSSTVRDLTVGAGIDFEDRGVHPLKGVPGEWRLLALAG